MTPPARACVFHLGALGDFILALPALRALRTGWPTTEIHLVGTAGWLPLARASGFVDRAVASDTLPLHAAFGSRLDPGHSLSRFLAGYEGVLSWFGDRDGMWESALRRLCPGRVRVDPLRGIQTFAGHASAYYLRTVSTLGIPVRPSLASDPWGRGPSRNPLAPDDRERVGPPLLFVHPGSGSRRKNWPLNAHRDAARTLLDRSELALRVILGPAEQDQASCWKALEGERLAVWRLPAITDLAAQLGRACLYLGNDSGVTHLAASVGAPTVALFGPTDPDRWGPLGPCVEVVRAPDGRLERISAEAVVDRLLSLR